MQSTVYIAHNSIRNYPLQVLNTGTWDQWTYTMSWRKNFKLKAYANRHIRERTRNNTRQLSSWPSRLWGRHVQRLCVTRQLYYSKEKTDSIDVDDDDIMMCILTQYPARLCFVANWQNDEILLILNHLQFISLIFTFRCFCLNCASYKSQHCYHPSHPWQFAGGGMWWGWDYHYTFGPEKAQEMGFSGCKVEGE